MYYNYKINCLKPIGVVFLELQRWFKDFFVLLWKLLYYRRWLFIPLYKFLLHLKLLSLKFEFCDCSRVMKKRCLQNPNHESISLMVPIAYRVKNVPGESVRVNTWTSSFDSIISSHILLGCLVTFFLCAFEEERSSSIKNAYRNLWLYPSCNLQGIIRRELLHLQYKDQNYTQEGGRVRYFSHQVCLIELRRWVYH